MTEPEQVLVNVADLRALEAWTHGNTYPGPEIGHLIAAIPEPEWEPTDDGGTAVTAACLTNWTNVVLVFGAFICGGAAFGAVVGWVSK